MIQAFQNYLANRDISSNFIDEEHSLLTFDFNNLHFLFSYRGETDPNYIRLMIPNIGSIDTNNAQDILSLFQLSQNYKVGKAIIEGGQLWLTADAFVFMRENNDRLFERLIAVLVDMFNDYRRVNNGQE